METTASISAWGAVKSWAQGVPTAWPLYRLKRVQVISRSPTTKKQHVGNTRNMARRFKWGRGFEILDLMRKGKFKVFRGLSSMSSFNTIVMKKAELLRGCSWCCALWIHDASICNGLVGKSLSAPPPPPPQSSVNDERKRSRKRSRKRWW